MLEEELGNHMSACSKSPTKFHEWVTATGGGYVCIYCQEKRPSIKELMKGTVLDGYVEAQRVKPLTEFMSTKMAEVDELGKTMLKASDVGDWDTYNKAKARREQLIREMQEVEEKTEKFWRDIDAQIEDETKAHDEYTRLAREAEQLGIAGWRQLDDVAMDEARHEGTLLAMKRQALP
jgi:hypothetical protein